MMRCGVEKYGAGMSAKTGRTVQAAQIEMEPATTGDEACSYSGIHVRFLHRSRR